MRTPWGKCGAVGLVLTGAVVFPCARLDAADPPRAAQYVSAAFQAELAGQNGQRKELLSRAIEADDSHTAARWQAGYVLHDGRWQTVEQVAAAAASNPVRQQYYELRTKTKDDAAGQLKLADWCRDHKMDQEARAHFVRVLQLDTDNPRAWVGLGYRRVRGAWATEAEIAALQAREQKQKQVDATWKSTIKRIRLAIEHPSAKVKEAGANELLSIRDVEAVVPLMRQLAGTNSATDELLVQTLANIPERAATEALAFLALQTKEPVTRNAAAARLGQRELEIYVPTLLSKMYIPKWYNFEGRWYHSQRRGQIEKSLVIERQYSIENWVETWHIKGLRATGEEPFTRRLTLQPRAAAVPQPINPPTPAEGGIYRVAPVLWIWEEANQQVAASPDVYKRLSDQARDVNQKISNVLNVALDENLPADPEIWWTWWNNYYGMSVTSKPLVAHQSHVRRFYFRSPSESCFTAGTPVTTISGPRPIEQVRIGDLVLAQDVKSGELNYKPVLQTTVRPPIDLLRVKIGNETIDCTPGHPFWVNGRGWTMARDLAEGSYLHGRSGAEPLWEKAAAAPQPTYNLVVDDFHSYFVGRAGLLVHDNGVWEPVEAEIPGMAMTK